VSAPFARSMRRPLSLTCLYRSLRGFQTLPLLLFLFFFLCWLAAERPPSALRAATVAASRSLEAAACARDRATRLSRSDREGLCALAARPAQLRPFAGDGGGGARPVGPPLQLLLRVSAGERSWSGAGRFLGWTKAHTALTTAYSLRMAIDSLEGAACAPRAVNVTVVYDGLQGDAPLLAAWQAALSAVFIGGRAAGSAPAVTLNHVAVPLSETGNRGSNLLQFRVLRALCAAAAAAAAPAGAGGGGSVAAAVMAAGAGASASPAPPARRRAATEGGGGGAPPAAGAAVAPPPTCAPGAGGPVAYLVEDDYIHAPSALAELLDVLTLPALDGAPPPRFATLLAHPDRELRGWGEAGGGAGVAVFGSTRRHWRHVPSTTMTFAGTCAALREALPALEELAPFDHPLWHRILQWRLVGLLPMGARDGVRLAAPLPSLAIHTTEEVSFYGPPPDAWGGAKGAPIAFGSWCGLAECLRDAALQHVGAHAGVALERLLRAPGGGRGGGKL
jgi:hypothetical protein